MPAARTGKKKAAPKKAKAQLAAEKAAKEAEEAEQAQQDQDEQEDIDMKEEEQPSAESSSSATEAKAEGSKSGLLKEVVEEIKEEVETVVEKAAETVAEVGAAAEEFVDKMTGVESSESLPQLEPSGKGKEKEGSVSVKEEVVEAVGKVAAAAEAFVEEMTGVESNGGSSDDKSRSQSQDADDVSGKPKLTMEERRAKMEQLRKKMAAGTRANRDSLVEEAAKAKLNARELARLERQRKLAETLRLKADAEERGEDAERAKNWEYTLEENDEWEKKLARKKRRADYEFHDDAHAARRRYKKDLDQIKPDLEAYNKQKALALGLNPSSSNALTAFSSTSTAVSTVTAEEQRIAHENLYRDANTLIYGDNKPSDEAIDRVVGKINKDIEKKAKFHRKRVNEVEGDITYINEHNRVFNNKIKRYYDKYTTEIRDSFERGTAL